MLLKHHIFNLYRRYVFLLSLMGRKVNENSVRKHNCIYIMTIAYNNEKLIERQIEQIKKYIKEENYIHVIADNSPDRNARRKIEDVCKRGKVEYVSIPLYIDRMINKKLFGYGLSHGAALNWVFYHYLKDQRTSTFVLLDHDVFPLKDYSFSKKLQNKDFYGVERNMGVGWYLWPGWCIFKYESIAKRDPNFLPVFMDGTYLDAGGGNYKQLYRHYDVSELEFPKVITKRVKKTDGLQTHDDIYHSDCIQYIDGSWLHIINGSNYAKIKGKEYFVKQILSDFD